MLEQQLARLETIAERFVHAFVTTVPGMSRDVVALTLKALIGACARRAVAELGRERAYALVQEIADRVVVPDVPAGD